jgi:ATP sulfurylase
LARCFILVNYWQTEAQYNSVVHDTRLPEGQLFGLPVTLDTDSEAIEVGDFVELVHSETGARGVLQVRVNGNQRALHPHTITRALHR